MGTSRLPSTAPYPGSSLIVCPSSVAFSLDCYLSWMSLIVQNLEPFARSGNLLRRVNGNLRFPLTITYHGCPLISKGPKRSIVLAAVSKTIRYGCIRVTSVCTAFPQRLLSNGISPAEKVVGCSPSWTAPHAFAVNLKSREPDPKCPILDTYLPMVRNRPRYPGEAALFAKRMRRSTRSWSPRSPYSN